MAFIKIDIKEHNRLEEMWMDPKEEQPFEVVLENSSRIKSWQKKVKPGKSSGEGA